MVDMRNDGEISYILHIRGFFHSFLQNLFRWTHKWTHDACTHFFTAEHITRQRQRRQHINSLGQLFFKTIYGKKYEGGLQANRKSLNTARSLT